MLLSKLKAACLEQYVDGFAAIRLVWKYYGVRQLQAISGRELADYGIDTAVLAVSPGVQQLLLVLMECVVL
jgi:hypothetical protein